MARHGPQHAAGVEQRPTVCASATLSPAFNGCGEYDYVSRWGIPDINVFTRLGSAIIADVVDLHGGATGPAARQHNLSLIGAHLLAT
jgi:hypothetical protein